MPERTIQSKATNAQISALLSNDLLARVERLRINSSRLFTARARGEHLASRRGMSTEFRDFRPYVEGDDTRFVDWNIFARLRKPFLKQFFEEQEQHVVILIDASSSMQFEAKLESAKQLAAAFAVMGLMGGERVSVHAFHGQGKSPESSRPAIGRVSIRKTLRTIEEIEAGGDHPLEQGIENFVKRHAGRGVVIILSDFMTIGDLRQAFNRLYSTGLEMFAIQICSPSEIAPELTGDLRLIDSETEQSLDVSNIGHLLSIYHEYRESLETNLRLMTAQRGGRYLQVNSAEPVEIILMETLRRRGWIK